MSNIGLELAFKQEGIDLVRANVGDKYVLEQLIATGSEIGGEQSGHIIFPAISLVGDGMMTALLLTRAIREKVVSLSEAVSGFVRYPQTLKNVKVREKRPFADVPEIAEAASRVEGELDGHGRLLLRYSGTENLARVMIEGKDQAVIESQAMRLADVIGAALG
jgi:phosphoglucosamine mutase